jgi:hypothetical protein
MGLNIRRHNRRVRAMGVGWDRLRAGSWGICRRALGVALIYAVVLQGIFLGFAGVATGVAVDEGYPAFELCLSGHQGGPLAPADLPGHHGNTHCILCFTGAHYGPGPPAPFSIERNLEIGNVRWPVADWRLSAFFEYSSAQPRGPPFGV